MFDDAKQLFAKLFHDKLSNAIIITENTYFTQYFPAGRFIVISIK